MYNIILNAFQTINELLTAGIAITAFSLLLYAFTFNLRDRVARSFAIILICVVIVFVGDTIGSTLSTPREMEFWLRLQWVGIVFLPSAYLHFSDALLATTGRPSRGLRRIIARLAYLISFAFFITIPFSILVGNVVQNAFPAPYLQRTWLTWVFTIFYTGGMVGSWINFFRAYQRTVTSTSRRRMQYLLAGALAPALGSFPYLLFGYNMASAHPLLFWAAALLANIMVYGLLIVMAYSVAFFGVSWPDLRVKAGGNGGRLRLTTNGATTTRKGLKKMRMKKMKLSEGTSVSLQKTTLILNQRSMKCLNRRVTRRVTSFM